MKTALIIILTSLLVLFAISLYIVHQAEAMITKCPPTGCGLYIPEEVGGIPLEPHLDQDTKEWLTLWFNQQGL